MAISLVVLSLGFSIVLARKGPLGGASWWDVLLLFPFVAFVLLFAFLGHELAHRQVARRLGYYAYYQAYYYLLPLAVILPLFFGFVFAAPGAVVISPYRLYGGGDPRRDEFFIAASGPVANIAFALVGLLLWETSPFWQFFAYINAWLAFFNLLPIPPLDGSKMVKTKPALWLPTIVAAGLLVWRLW
ncbi:site-2 protease family protein [Pyrobaculum sp.]|uniref:site-2 protease family protein n=1 Tax=Pyrobaculum sp. TaxID=2004705 RepID=UPI0031752A32